MTRGMRDTHVTSWSEDECQYVLEPFRAEVLEMLASYHDLQVMRAFTELDYNDKEQPNIERDNNHRREEQLCLELSFTLLCK
jgi:hypothetical protein